MKNMSNLYQKSNKIFYDNITWLLSSDIRIRDGENKGAIYGWKNLNPPSFPFIYSEITGYAITCFSWIASEFGNQDALEAAQEASDWIVRNLHSNLLVARPPALGNDPNDLTNLFYSFDNSMIVIGLLSLYKITKKPCLLELAQTLTQVLIERFFDGEKLIPRLDNSFNPIKHSEDKGLVKWSTISGAYHCKLSIGLLELSRLTDTERYARISDSLCDYAKKLQKSNGQFVTNPRSDIAYLHPHLYACEGLIYSGIKQSNDSHYRAGLNGIKWATEQIDSNGKGGLIRDTGKEPIEQSDCTAQLLRLLILCRTELEKTVRKSELSNVIQRLHLRLLDFYIPAGEGQGAMRYQLGRESACSWCTMFSMQALRLWSLRDFHLSWIDYFV
jgi:Glycosyl hydrolase family 47